MRGFYRMDLARAFQISEPTYNRLMHQLTLAGAQRRTTIGSGRAGTHGEFGDIAVARIKWPSHVAGHPPVAFFAESAREDVRGRLQAA